MDYEKAFNRVDHGFLLEALAKIGLEEGFISLVRGLISGASSKVHTNGMFLEEIFVGQGVRQGCPLSQLLFAFATQSFLDYLRFLLNSGCL